MATTIGGSVTVVTALVFSHVDGTVRDIRTHAFKIESIQTATDQHEAQISKLRTQRTEDLANNPGSAREIYAEYSKQVAKANDILEKKIDHAQSIEKVAQKIEPLPDKIVAAFKHTDTMEMVKDVADTASKAKWFPWSSSRSE